MPVGRNGSSREYRQSHRSCKLRPFGLFHSLLDYDAFLTHQRELADQLSAKRLEQITRQKDAELAQAQIAALEQRTRDAAARKASLEESLTALADRSAVCRAEIEAIQNWQKR